MCIDGRSSVAILQGVWQEENLFTYLFFELACPVNKLNIDYSSNIPPHVTSTMTDNLNLTKILE